MDDHKYSSRLKSINLTKLQESYKKYIKVVPKDCRITQLSDSWHVSTPDHRVNLSHSQWKRKLSRWRKLVHRWDYVSESDFDSLSESLKRGDIKDFVATCERGKSEIVDSNVCDHLLNDHTPDLYYPVIYKPSWFKGPLSHNGFNTVDESKFLNRSNDLLSNLDKDFNTKFMSVYTNNYTP